ncbi:hypothetical protein IC617_15150 [Neiella sp. HB171785]|uniref:CpsD/CapB family tyrosine-protein kinase n=1 Tax=Neiella litorisoli TaxID=2771431 RepID=A0A8J6UQB5_9GAMM|nr:hypothetical protein [Neiella litorisoli]MBD1390767.1 hypothetical protein [Neiella litorisoli]
MTLPVSYQELECVYQRLLISSVRCLAVSAAKSGEGVSLMVDALAKRSASVGKKVLVVDFNLFHPRIGADDWHWSNGQAPQPRTMDDDSIWYLPAPLDAASRLRLKEPGQLEALVAQWTAEFDLVLFDCAAQQLNNQSNLPPSRVMAAADGVVICYLAGVTASCQLQSCCQQLTQDGVNIVGVVMNDRFNPSLKLELIRNLQKFSHRWPKLTTWFTKKVYDSQLLSLRY